MPFGLNYAEGGPQDVAAINRLGATFSDALVGMHQQRLAQQRFMLQQVLEQGRLDIERKKLEDMLATSKLERNAIEADTEYKRAAADRESAVAERTRGLTTDLAEQGKAGSVYAKTQALLSKNRDNPFMIDILKAIEAQSLGKIASYDPGHIGEQGAMLGAMRRDPRMQDIIATGTPLYANVPPNQSRVSVLGGPSFQAPPAQTTPEEVTADRQRFIGQLVKDTQDPYGGAARSPLGIQAEQAAQDELRRMQPSQPSVSTDEATRRAIQEDQRAHPGMHRVVDVNTGRQYLVSEGQYQALLNEKGPDGQPRYHPLY